MIARMEEEELNESAEIKAERRAMVADLTAQFLSAGSTILEVPRGKSARRIYGVTSKKNKSASPVIVVEGEEGDYKVGQNPASQFIFEQKSRNKS